MLKGDFWYINKNIICVQKRISGQKRFWNPKKLFDIQIKGYAVGYPDIFMGSFAIVLPSDVPLMVLGA